MTSPTTIDDFALEADLSERPWIRARRLPALGPSAAESAAHSCLVLFLGAALRPDTEGSGSLAAALFAHGAVDAFARRAELGRGARARLERTLLRAIAGSRRRAISAWRRTLCEHGNTPRGRALRRCGEEAAHAWLRGDAPPPRLEAALRGASV